ncbi:hypothetical protein [Nostoc piscinale]|nr:hypothetical protein [Nostoc piscinale]
MTGKATVTLTFVPIPFAVVVKSMAAWRDRSPSSLGDMCKP